MAFETCLLHTTLGDAVFYKKDVYTYFHRSPAPLLITCVYMSSCESACSLALMYNVEGLNSALKSYGVNQVCFYNPNIIQ